MEPDDIYVKPGGRGLGASPGAKVLNLLRWLTLAPVLQKEAHAGSHRGNDQIGQANVLDIVYKSHFHRTRTEQGQVYRNADQKPAHAKKNAFPEEGSVDLPEVKNRKEDRTEGDDDSHYRFKQRPLTVMDREDEERNDEGDEPDEESIQENELH